MRIAMAITLMTTNVVRARSVPFLILVGLLAAVADPAPALGQDLPPAIQMDRYLLQAEEHIASGDYRAALAALESIRMLGKESNLELETLPTFWFRDAQAALGAGLHARAETSAARYLEVTGREGEHYTAVLQLLNQVELMAAHAEWREEAGCDEGWPGLVEFADIEVVRICLETGSDVNAPDERGYFALHRASAGGNAEVAEILIGAGADVNARDQVVQVVGSSDGTRDSYVVRSTPLLHAVEASNVETVELLIEAGADVNATTDKMNYRRSSLQAAIESSDTRIAELLIDAGADVNHDSGGWTMFFFPLRVLISLVF